MSALNVNGREKSMIFYADQMEKNMWETFCKIAGKNPDENDWLRVNFDASDVDDSDDDLLSEDDLYEDLEMLTKDKAKSIIADLQDHDRIIRALTGAGYKVNDDTNECGYLNLKVNNPDGTMIRVYKNGRKEISIQVWEPVQFKYSGIPVFDPSRPTCSHH